MSNTFITCWRIWIKLVTLWFLGVACLFFYQDYQIHLACAQVDRINAAVALLQAKPETRRGRPLSLEDLVKRGLLDPSDLQNAGAGAEPTLYILKQVPDAGQPAAMVKFRDTIGRWRLHPRLDPSWDLYQTAASLSPD
jgi:hypothetical protein